MEKLKIKQYEVILDSLVYRFLKDRKFGIYGAVHRKPYVRISIEGTWIPLHRLLCEARDGEVIDHINGNQFDNRIKNLRSVSYSENRINANKPILGRPQTSIYRGVRKRSKIKLNWKPWTARLQYKKISIHLGSFHTELEAAKAYDKSAKKLLGQYAKLNF